MTRKERMEMQNENEVIIRRITGSRPTRKLAVEMPKGRLAAERWKAAYENHESGGVA